MCSCFSKALKSTGLLTSDPRLRDCMRQIHQAIQESVGTAMMDQELFRKWVENWLSNAKHKRVCVCMFSWYAAVASLIVYDLQLLCYMHTLKPLTGEWYLNVPGSLEIQAVSSSCTHTHISSHLQIYDLTFCSPAEVNTTRHLFCLYVRVHAFCLSVCEAKLC